MDTIDIDESSFIMGEPKLHGSMYNAFHPIVCKVMGIFSCIEASRPRSKSGIQALCSLHVALDRAKTLLQHCSDCSKLYLAITSDSILVKFEKARFSLQESLRRVVEIVTEHICNQIMEIVGELDEVSLSLDQCEKEAGDEIISLLQNNQKSNNTNSTNSAELEIFHQAALKLGITSSRAVLTERRSLKKLIERARSEEDKRKESVLSYLYHLIRKYSKLFRSEFGDDTDSQSSAPCSPTVLGFEDSYGSCGGISHAFDRNLSKIRSFNFRPSGFRSGNLPLPPEELRCPISLQLMYDPVIVASGQTYERVCIEKWFNDGHKTCPKTQQELAHLCLTPNYCVKGLIASWCEHNGFPIPESPPDNFDINWSSENGDSNIRKIVEVVPLEESCVTQVAENSEHGSPSPSRTLDSNNEGYNCLLAMLEDGKSTSKRYRLVERIRYVLKDDAEARIQMGATGFAEALVRFLRLAVYDGDEKAQEMGAMALFNLTVSNNRNKALLISTGVLELLEQMITKRQTTELATALYLNLSCLDEAKPVIGSSQAVPRLVQLLHTISSTQCKHDSLYTLYNLSTHQPNIPCLLSSGILDGLYSILMSPPSPEGDLYWSEKALAVLINLASTQAGRKEILSSPGLITFLATLLDTGESTEQEQAVACLLVMCNGDEQCIPIILQEGIIPSLVSVSVNGTARGQEKAQKLLKLFREQRQREPSFSPSPEEQEEYQLEQQQRKMQQMVVKKSMCKSRSKKFGRTLSAILKYRSCSVYQC
ncbi:hypothetical protein LUZ63_003494 [Rhynchospora breviuscula]|uniref:RING-type E3 ubiquitin transferase n=1 Tax=Rhynchospora breviuscula TaxID=2022672 RepID=A0A9Q0D1E5_9POAL|nr:hypothetical protein LUZ63_003494 [Rhynchospora breviuscula]